MTTRHSAGGPNPSSGEAGHLRVPLDLAHRRQHDLLVAHRAAAVLLYERRESTVRRLEATARADCHDMAAVTIQQMRVSGMLNASRRLAQALPI